MFSIKNISVAIQEKEIIKDLSLDCLPGSVHIIMGPNGSGKSSLVSAIMGQPRYEIKSGAVYLDGNNIIGLPVEKRARAGIFVAFQYPYEIPGVTVFTFLREAYRAVRQSDISVIDFKKLLEEACESVGLPTSYAYRYLNDGFSGGEKKRLELIQLLLLQPKVAILDEIDSGLDADGLVAIGGLCADIKARHPDMIFIIITHYPQLINFFEKRHIHIMIKGSLVASGDDMLTQRVKEQGYNAFL